MVSRAGRAAIEELVSAMMEKNEASPGTYQSTDLRWQPGGHLQPKGALFTEDLVVQGTDGVTYVLAVLAKMESGVVMLFFAPSIGTPPDGNPLTLMSMDVDHMRSTALFFASMNVLAAVEIKARG